MGQPKVLNARIVNRSGPDRVFIGRPSKWGNPFIIGRDGTRDEVIRLYAEYIVSSPLISDIEELRGKDLVCFCSPRPCHGDILLKLANQERY